MSGKADKDISLSEQKLLILQYARENGSITRKDVEDLIGTGTTKAFRLLKELCATDKLDQKETARRLPMLSNKIIVQRIPCQ